MADAARRAHGKGLSVPHPEHVALRAHLHAAAGADAAVRIDDRMERHGLVQAVLDRVAAGRDRVPLTATVAEDEGDDRRKAERESHCPYENPVPGHQKRVQNPA
jgi:hypothetical protein